MNMPVWRAKIVLKCVLVSAVESTLEGSFQNCQTGKYLKLTCEALGGPQPATQCKTDYSTANSFINDTLKGKRSKSWDVRHH